MNMRMKKQVRPVILAVALSLCAFGFIFAQDIQEDKRMNKPIEVNGDTVEYSPENKTVTAKGTVDVFYKGSRLSCEKLTVNTETKDGIAEGNVRIEDEKGSIRGSNMTYNFNTKSGTVSDAWFGSYPYYGRSYKIDRVSDKEFVAFNGYATSCSYDVPHYRLKSKKINMYPKDKIVTAGDTLYIGRLPVAYLSRYSHSLKDPLMHVQITPGKSKIWGPYLLTAWRFNVTDNLTGRIYADYRTKAGAAEGFGANYKTENFGKGDIKFYYTQERPRNLLETQPGEFQRYFVRWRHKWNISDRTSVTHEYFKIVDSKRMLLGTEYNILKDYFPREYEKDSTPLSYTTLHHNFDQASLDVIVQKRVNRWYTQLEKLPEVNYSLPSMQLGESPFYFSDSTVSGLYNQKTAVPSDSWNDVSLFRTDTTNKFSMPMKVSFISLTPFVGMRNTIDDKNVAGTQAYGHLRSIFLTGADASTKFYRLFNAKTNALGLDINGLRHIITPTVGYAYNHAPTVPGDKLKLTDSIYNSSNAATLELDNKLQTKRKGIKVDLADFRVKNVYTFRPEKTIGAHGSNFSDTTFDFEAYPYSWLTFDSDAVYNHYSDYFTQADYDVTFNLGKERGVSIGQRYLRKNSNQYTISTEWRLTPKWKVRIYERIQLNSSGAYEKKHGVREQEYAFIRDLHCWTTEISYNVRAGEGTSLWLIFRLKAFPEVEFNLDHSYQAPKAGSQSS